MKYIWMIALLSLLGCAQNTYYAKQNSAEWTELACSGFETWQDCRAEAQTICPNGFYIANQLENLLIQRRVVEVACKS